MRSLTSLSRAAVVCVAKSMGTTVASYPAVSSTHIFMCIQDVPLESATTCWPATREVRNSGVIPQMFVCSAVRGSQAAYSRPPRSATQRSVIRLHIAFLNKRIQSTVNKIRRPAKQFVG